MKNTNELANFFGLSVNAVFASAEKGQTFVQRIGNFVPTIMSAEPAFNDSVLIDDEVEAAESYEELIGAAKVAFDAMTDVPMPGRAIYAQQIGVLVLGMGATKILDRGNTEEPKVVA